jgi:outer membrane protein assembly factor BamB
MPTGPPQPEPTPGQRPGTPDQSKERKDKNKPPEKFGPISLFPMVQAWTKTIGAGPVPGLAFDSTFFYVALKVKQVAALTIGEAEPRWTIEGVDVVQPLVADGGRLYMVLDGGEVAAFEPSMTAGKPLWRLPMGDSVSGPPIARKGWLLVALENGELHALRGATGETVWQTKFDAAIKTPPVIVGDRLYVAPQDNRLVALDLVSGHQLWDEQFDGLVGAIAAQEQRVYVGVGRMFFALDHAGHLKWKRRIGAEVIGQPVADESAVYAAFTDNTLYAFGASDGDFRWRSALAYRPIAGPVHANKTLILTGVAPVLHGYNVKDGKAAIDFNPAVDARSIVVSAPLFVPGRTFFQDSVVMLLAQGVMVSGRPVGPGFLSPFSDPGRPCRPWTMPSEAPPPTAAAAPPPKR